MCFLERVESIEWLQNREVGQSLWIGVGEKDWTEFYILGMLTID